MAKPNLTVVPPAGLRIEDMPNITKEESAVRTTYIGTREALLTLGIYPDFIFPTLPKRKKVSWRDLSGQVISDEQCEKNQKRYDFEMIYVSRMKGGNFEVEEHKSHAKREQWEKEERRKRDELKTPEQYANRRGRFIGSLIETALDVLQSPDSCNPKGFYFKRDKAVVKKLNEARAILKKSSIGVRRNRLTVVK